MTTHHAIHNNHVFLELCARLDREWQDVWNELSAPCYHWMATLVPYQREHPQRSQQHETLIREMAASVMEHTLRHLTSWREWDVWLDPPSALPVALDFLKERGVVRDDEETRVRVRLDSTADYQAVLSPTAMQLEEVEVFLTVRRVRLRHAPDMLAWIEARNKSVLSQWMKIERLGHDQPIPDRLGIRLILDCAYGSPEWEQTVCSVVESLRSDMGERSVTPSHRSVRATAFLVHYVQLRIGTLHTDMQILPIQTAINTRLSLREENDRFYRQRRWEQFRERFRPQCLYGEDWSDPTVQRRQREAIAIDLATLLEGRMGTHA